MEKGITFTTTPAGRPTARPGATRPQALLHRRRRSAWISLVAGLAVWELAARFVVHNSLFLVPFTAVMMRLAHMAVTGQLWPHLSASFYEFIIGFILATTSGIVIGALMAASPPVEEYLDVWVTFLYATPLVAMMPFFIIVFGVGLASKIAIVYVLVLFPVLVNTFSGLRSSDPDLLEMIHSFGARPVQVFWEVLLPSALPFILAGLRLGVGRGLIAVVVGELFFSQKGVGYLINLAGQSFDTAMLFVGVFILSVTGVVLTSLLQSLERRMAPWRQ